MAELQILNLKLICPKCGGTQFSIVPPSSDMSRPDLPPGVLGLADCRSCQQDFFVKLPQELMNSIASMFSGGGSFSMTEIIGRLF